MHSLGITASHTRAMQFLGSNTSTTSTATLPSGLEVGDLLIGCTINQEEDAVAGWTVGGSGTSGALDYLWHWKYYEVTDTQYDTNGGDFTAVFAFRNVDPLYPFDTAATVATGATGLPNAPSITTVNPSSIVIALGFLDDDNTTMVAPSGYRRIAAIGETSSGSIVAAYKEVVNAGAEDPGAFTGTGTDEWAAVSIALRSNAYFANMSATGGTEYTDGGYKYHKFTANGDFVVSTIGSNPPVEILAVGGGGGGGRGTSGGGSGGGGAGGVVASTITATATTYSIVVGGGGSGSATVGSAGGDGTTSTFDSTTVTAGGGGGGGSSGTTSSIRNGRAGLATNGNGGGGAATGTAAGTGGAGSGDGFNGGTASAGNGGGGGGGAGGNGGNSVTSNTGGSGGLGTDEFSTWATATSSGENGFFASGGGGGGDATGGTVSDGGGGSGRSGTTSGVAGDANTGGGGGGQEAGTLGITGGNGGSGIVIVRYKVA